MTSEIARVLLVALLLTGCSERRPDIPAEWRPPTVAEQAVLDEWDRTHYSQPDFADTNVYRVQNQTGCWFWISSGRKFDGEWVALNENGQPDCPAGVIPPSVETW